jgi:hypothetical protein
MLGSLACQALRAEPEFEKFSGAWLPDFQILLLPNPF